MRGCHVLLPRMSPQVLCSFLFAVWKAPHPLHSTLLWAFVGISVPEVRKSAAVCEGPGEASLKPTSQGGRSAPSSPYLPWPWTPQRARLLRLGQAPCGFWLQEEWPQLLPHPPRQRASQGSRQLPARRGQFYFCSHLRYMPPSCFAQDRRGVWVTASSGPFWKLLGSQCPYWMNQERTRPHCGSERHDLLHHHCESARKALHFLEWPLLTRPACVSASCSSLLPQALSPLQSPGGIPPYLLSRAGAGGSFPS